jgi:xanthine/uracil/vitamin C permease (AzgA family)
MQPGIYTYLLLAVLTSINIVLSVAIFEVCLKLQNLINSLGWLEIARKLLLVILGGLLLAVFMSIKIFASEASGLEQGNCVLVYLVVIIYYLFKYYFPRQKYIVKDNRKE